jgi:hypothetical protein
MKSSMPIDGAQRMQALQRANEVRVARAALKRMVAAGAVSVADAILGRSAEIESMAVIDLLMSQRSWGHARCNELLAAVPLPETKTVGSMTDRQRSVLVALLRAPGPTARVWSTTAPRPSSTAGAPPSPSELGRNIRSAQRRFASSTP